MQWFIRRAFNTPHSSKQIEDAIGVTINPTGLRQVVTGQNVPDDNN